MNTNTPAETRLEFGIVCSRPHPHRSEPYEWTTCIERSMAEALEAAREVHADFGWDVVAIEEIHTTVRVVRYPLKPEDLQHAAT